MPYATATELAVALRITVSAANQDALDACLEAAAIEINDALDLTEDAAPDALLNRVNILRGVEWWKSNDAAFGAPAGGGGVVLESAPSSTFARHSATLTPLKTSFGVA